MQLIVQLFDRVPQDVDGIMALLTDLPQEERVIARVEHKASVFGQDMSGTAESPAHKVRRAGWTKLDISNTWGSPLALSPVPSRLTPSS